MYSEVFCEIYNQLGWNAFPEAFGEQLLIWLQTHQVEVTRSLDLGCGTGVLCELLFAKGILAEGLDLSEGMIQVAKARNPRISYQVADMVTFRPQGLYDLVTCTGDALNHLPSPEQVDAMFHTVHGCLRPGGYFIFDILREEEVPVDEAFAFDFDERIHACFHITREEGGLSALHVQIYENGIYQFEEVIRERIYPPAQICDLLQRQGFEVVKCSDRLLEEAAYPSTTCFLIARA